MNTQKTNFMVPLAFVGVMFFAIGFALGINSFLMPVLEKSLQMSSAESNLLLAATFVPFLIFGIPATKCIEHIGYKRTMALSFVLFAAAFGLFIQAAATASIVWFLIASFVAGAGFSKGASNGAPDQLSGDYPRSGHRHVYGWHDSCHAQGQNHRNT